VCGARRDVEDVAGLEHPRRSTTDLDGQLSLQHLEPLGLARMPMRGRRFAAGRPRRLDLEEVG
jgi:hypothetical protein